MGGHYLTRWFMVGVGVMGVAAVGVMGASGEKPTMEQVRAELSDADFGVRRHGVKDLQGILARQVVELTTSDDPELSAALEKTAEEQASLIRWTLGVLKGGAEEQKKAVQWALSEAIRPSMTLVLSSDEGARERGMAFLAQQKGAEAEVVLGSLIADEDPYRSCEAIDAVYERAPSAPVLAALWQITSKGLMPTDYSARMPGFQGQHVSVAGSRPPTASRLNFPPAAMVLAKYKDPSTTPLLGALLPQLNNAGSWSTMGGDDRTAAFFALAQACNSEAVQGFVYQLAIGKVTGTSAGSNYYHSNRSAMLALFAILIGQTPADFGMHQGRVGSPDEWHSDSPTAEGEAMLKATAWWTAHHPAAG